MVLRRGAVLSFVFVLGDLFFGLPAASSEPEAPLRLTGKATRSPRGHRGRGRVGMDSDAAQGRSRPDVRPRPSHMDHGLRVEICLVIRRPRPEDRGREMPEVLARLS